MGSKSTVAKMGFPDTYMQSNRIPKKKLEKSRDRRKKHTWKREFSQNDTKSDRILWNPTEFDAATWNSAAFSKLPRNPTKNGNYQKTAVGRTSSVPVASLLSRIKLDRFLLPEIDESRCRNLRNTKTTTKTTELPEKIHNAPLLTSN